MNMTYERHFARGYLLASSKLEHRLLADWRVLPMSSYRLYLHRLTQVDVAYGEEGRAWVAIIGLSIDLSSDTGVASNAGKALGILESQGEDACLRYLSYLGGRFLAVVIRGDQVMIVPDCHATYACYLHQGDSRSFYASSHSNLLGDLFDLDLSLEAKRLMNHPDYISPAGKYYPATLTPYDRVSVLFPNCLVKWEPESSFAHRRFYPFQEKAKVFSEDELFDQFCDILEGIVRVLAQGRRLGVSLTGGWDSRVTVAALAHVANLKEHFAFTYYRPDGAGTMAGDLFSASWLSSEIGLVHRVVHLRPVDYASDFHRMYQVSFARGARHPALARSYYEQLPHDFCSLVSTCSETATVFYQDRSVSFPSADVLAAKFTTSKIKSDPGLIRLFEDYIRYSEFTPDRFGEIDFYDLFYWEHRNAKWASLWYAEADLAHFTVAPFNHRGLMEVMLSLPLEARASKLILRRFLKSRLGAVHLELETLQDDGGWKE